MPEDIKAAALADLATGEQPAVVAQRYRLKASTVRSWKLRMERDGTPVATPATLGATEHATPAATSIVQPTIQDRQARLQQLVIDNLEAKLIATQRIAEHAAQTTWLDRQSAANVAALFTVLDHSAVGILDRLAGRAAVEGAEEG